MLGAYSDILDTTLSAAQASISVLLVLAYGLAAEKYKIMTIEGEKEIAHLGVTIFLPALLFSEIAPQATASRIASYWIIIVLAVWTQLLSYIVGVVLRMLFKLPQWVIPCMIFNNVTSLPLFLLSSLKSQKVLEELAREGDTSEDVYRRARNYILINAIVCNLARFLLGPALMSRRHQIDHIFTHHETPHLLKSVEDVIDPPEDDSSQLHDPEQRPLLEGDHGDAAHHRTAKQRIKSIAHRAWAGFKSIMNPPMIGGVAALIVGITPFLRKLLIPHDSPLSTFTDSIRTLGKIYSALQMFVLGGQLYSKRAHLGAFILIAMWRFLAMPCASISTIYFVRKVTPRGLIKSDPVLDFTLAIAPAGPPAITLAAVGNDFSYVMLLLTQKDLIDRGYVRHFVRDTGLH